ncbi:MAG: hypothetical protein F6K24_28190 [Okeania sp. SIO2D1]|nr:hypothetical protein [Okeania sp. SIO2D1]
MQNSSILSSFMLRKMWVKHSWERGERSIFSKIYPHFQSRRASSGVTQLKWWDDEQKATFTAKSQSLKIESEKQAFARFWLSVFSVGGASAAAISLVSPIVTFG